MIEAYEIGIRLALQDGVSEGIAAIRRDLGSLDQAIAQTTLRLGQLQRIGAQALAASQELPERTASGLPARRPAPMTMPTPLLEAEPLASPVDAQTVTPMPLPSPRPPAGPPSVLTAIRTPAKEPDPVSPTVVIRPAAAVVETTTRPAAVAVEGVRAAISPRPPEQPAAAPSSGAVPPVPAPVAAVAARLAGPKLQVSNLMAREGGRAQETASPSPARRAPPAPDRAAVAPQQVPAEPGRREEVRPLVQRRDEAREVHARHSAAASGPPVARVMPALAAPAGVLSPTSSVAPAASSSYAPPPTSSRARETSVRGDVFFDGARVGRWMSEQMARDAGRPNTGPTGFDPRRSPAWPGAAVTW